MARRKGTALARKQALLSEIADLVWQIKQTHVLQHLTQEEVILKALQRWSGAEPDNHK